MQLRKRDLLVGETGVVLMKHSSIRASKEKILNIRAYIIRMEDAFRSRVISLKYQPECFIPSSPRPTHVHIRAGKLSFWVCKEKDGEEIASSILTGRGVFIKIPLNAKKVSFPYYNYPKEQHCYGKAVWG